MIAFYVPRRRLASIISGKRWETLDGRTRIDLWETLALFLGEMVALRRLPSWRNHPYLLWVDNAFARKVGESNRYSASAPWPAIQMLQ